MRAGFSQAVAPSETIAVDANAEGAAAVASFNARGIDFGQILAVMDELDSPTASKRARPIEASGPANARVSQLL